MKNIDKYRGCLIGGAAGDALGYAVEFLDDAAIFSKYGENGITEQAQTASGREQAELSAKAEKKIPRQGQIITT